MSGPLSKCPFGFGSSSSSPFEIGSLSCIICKSLLFHPCRCIPCQHLFCRACIRKLSDCVVCGVAVESVEEDSGVHEVVEGFVQGHLRGDRLTKSSEPSISFVDKLRQLSGSSYTHQEKGNEFLLQQAVRALQGGNLESAKARLNLCLEDLRSVAGRQTLNPSDLKLAQIGAILGLLGDCWRVEGNAEEALRKFHESVQQMSLVKEKDSEVTRSLCVSLNKIGDLMYRQGDVASARTFYLEALGHRQAIVGEDLTTADPSQVLDLAISLAKMADVERAFGNDEAAHVGFRRAAEVAEGVCVPDDVAHMQMAHKKISTVNYLQAQLRQP